MLPEAGRQLTATLPSTRSSGGRQREGDGRASRAGGFDRPTSPCGAIAGGVVSCTVTSKLPVGRVARGHRSRCSAPWWCRARTCAGSGHASHCHGAVDDVGRGGREGRDGAGREVASNVCGGGSVIVGGVVSSTWIAMLALEVLRWVSVAVQVTVESPTMNVLPEGGVQVARPGPSTASVVVAANVTDGAVRPRGFRGHRDRRIDRRRGGVGHGDRKACLGDVVRRILHRAADAGRAEREQAGRRRAGQQMASESPSTASSAVEA